MMILRKELARHTPSPIKKYLLAHATLLHRESQDIEKQVIKKLLQQKKDIILDRTLATFKKSYTTVKKFKNKGYKITTLGTNLPPHIAILSATRRFLKKGRYVPLKNVIAKKGNRINRNVLKMARSDVSHKSTVYDTTVRKKPKVLYQKGKKRRKRKKKR